MITLYRFRDIDSRRLFRDCNIYEIENVMNCFSRDFCVKCVSLCDSSQFLFHSSKAFNASMIICISLQLCNVCISIYCLDWRIATLPRSLSHHYSEIACLIIIIGPDGWHWVPPRRAMRRAWSLMHKAPDLPDVADDGPAVLIVPDDRNHRNHRISSRTVRTLQ